MVKIQIHDSYNHQTTYNISSEKELKDLLYKILSKEPSVFIIDIPNNGIFTLGIGRPYGFIQYSRSDEPPYLIALNETFLENYTDDIEFDSGGTPTPISIRQCLPYDQVVDILVYCFNHQKLPDNVIWEEI